MSAPRHTPGPWSASKIDDRAAFQIFTPGQCSALLTLEPGLHTGADPRAGNVEADARLIAASPELLAALLAIVEEAGPRMGLDDTPGTINTISRLARAAILKATGGAA